MIEQSPISAASSRPNSSLLQDICGACWRNHDIPAPACVDSGCACSICHPERFAERKYVLTLFDPATVPPRDLGAPQSANKLDSGTREMVRRLYGSGVWTAEDLAARFDMNVSTIQNAVQGVQRDQGEVRRLRDARIASERQAAFQRVIRELQALEAADGDLSCRGCDAAIAGYKNARLMFGGHHSLLKAAGVQVRRRGWKARDQRRDVVVPLFEQGLSVSQVAERTGFAQTTVSKDRRWWLQTAEQSVEVTAA